MNVSTVTRPWGSFTEFTKNEQSTVKLISVTKGEELSLQYHNHRDEFWRVISGNPQLTIGEENIDAKPDDEFNISAKTEHRISAPNDDVVILEISTGNFDEEDIVRLKDKYNRV